MPGINGMSRANEHFGNAFAMDSIALPAAAVRKVTSIILRPPSSSALPSGLSFATLSMMIDGNDAELVEC